MNLFEMVSRGDGRLALKGAVQQHKLTVDGKVWRGLIVPPGAEIRVRQALLNYPIYDRPETCGWFACSPKGEKGGKLLIAFEHERITSARRILPVEEKMVGVPLPWQFGIPLPMDSDLVIRSKGEAPFFLAVAKAMKRTAIIGLAQGHGLELGPGAHPQILEGAPGVESVIYVEQQVAEDWSRLYEIKGEIDKDLWKAYRQGNADALPVEDASLDFIFSSHVFEHLANPIGHLRHWATKLKPGGRVLGIIPEMSGAKDYRQRPCALADLIAEDEGGVWEPTEAHYRRYVANSAPGADVEKWMRDKRSIHVHFYTTRNLSELFDYACRNLGYAWSQISHEPNNKEAYFMLAKAGEEGASALQAGERLAS